MSSGVMAEGTGDCHLRSEIKIIALPRELVVWE